MKAEGFDIEVSSRFSPQFCLPANVTSSIPINIYTWYVFAPHNHEGVRQRYQLVSVDPFVVAKNGMWYFQ